MTLLDLLYRPTFNVSTEIFGISRPILGTVEQWSESLIKQREIPLISKTFNLIHPLIFNST